MLHRHFENELRKNMTTRAVLNGGEKEASPPEEDRPRRGRKKKTEE